MKSVAFGIVVLLACINIGLSLKCYVNTHEEFTEDDAKEGTALYNYKTCSKLITHFGDTTTVLRAGLPNSMRPRCVTMGSAETCFCNVDGCNGDITAETYNETIHADHSGAHTTAAALLPFLLLPALIIPAL